MRYVMMGVLAVAVMLTAAGCGGRASAAEWPRATLVPADASSYSELNLDRLLGKTPETAALREAFANMQSVEVVRGLLTQEQEVAQGFDEVMEVLGGLSEAIGPRVGWAMWMPNMAEMMGGMTAEMMGGMAGPAMPPGMPGMPSAMPGMFPFMSGMPKVLVVAEVRDGAKLEELIEHIVTRLEIPSSEGKSHAGAKVTKFAEGQVALARGQEWLALGFPAEMVQAAADRAAGKSKEGSLWEEARYQQVLGRLPKDAVMTQYASAESVKQMLAMVQMFAPSAEFAPPGDEGLGWAMGVRVEEKAGQQMVTAYTTADLNTVPYLIDAPIALQAAMMYPMFTRSRESAQKAVCLSNTKNLALAMQMWLADHNDEFPKTERWVEELMPYIGNEGVLKCPGDESGARSSYGLNKAVIGKRLVDVEDPAGLVVFYETANPGENPVGGPEDVAPPRHMGGNDFAFADGHVEWVHAGRVPSFEVE